MDACWKPPKTRKSHSLLSFSKGKKEETSVAWRQKMGAKASPALARARPNRTTAGVYREDNIDLVTV